MIDATLKSTLVISGREFIIHAKPANEVVIKVEVFKSWVSMYEDGSKQYPIRGAVSGMDTTDDLEQAQRMFTGTIKWDGCSDLNFFPDEDGYEHFCGRKGAIALGELINQAYEIAWGMMPNSNDRELFDGH